MITKFRFFLLVAMLCALVPACSKKPNQARVHGKITYKGQDVTGGSIYFHEIMEDGKFGGNYRYIIKPDATYEATDLPEKEMGVSIETESINPKAGQQSEEAMKKSQIGKGEGGFADPKKMMEMMKKGTQLPEAGQTYGTYVQIPKKYADPTTSKLKTTLKSGNNTADWNLTDD
jgi:hypothetical protein